jgi:serine/threonine protein kinase
MATALSRLGRYKIEAELGRGAMGIVYRARDPRIDRTVAIKTVSLFGLEPEAEQEYRERFIIEAKAAGRLSHPRIITIFDVAEDQNILTPYIVMEHVSGHSLEEMLSRDKETFAFDSALRLTEELADALDYAHSQGIVHRDIKPSNIIVAEDGHPKIADFGIAKLNAPGLPQAKRYLGTPAYMSPEQLRGDPVDGRSDLFSLGIILYQLVTNHRPFQGNSTHTISFKVLNREPVAATALNAELSPELGQVITRAMAKDPAQRYQSGKEMALELQKLREQSLSSNGDYKQPLDERGNLPANWDRTISFAKTTRFASKLGRSRQENEFPFNATRFTQPWQQISVSLAILAFLGLLFTGLWQTIPIHAAPISATAAIAPSKMLNPAGPGPLPQAERNSTNRGRRKSLSGRMPNNSASVTQASLATPKLPQALDQFIPSTLRISVEHHFETAHLSVWIDEKLTYSYPLRGTLKKRMLLFRGVQGYFSDSVEVAGGEHLIRVRVASADNSYDELGSIRAHFTPGSEKILTAQFNRNNRGMRLSLQ